jgi:uncharacterized protein (DUF58 family)
VREAVPEGIRITKAGTWFVVLTLVVGATGTNTGNSALYMVFASMLALLVVSGFLSQQNVRSLEVGLVPPSEVFARRPTRVTVELRNRARWRSRWLLRFAPVLLEARRDARSGRAAKPNKSMGVASFVGHLPARGGARRDIDLWFERRGLQRLHGIRVTSAYPLGFFHKGLRYRSDAQVLVYPELFDTGASRGLGADVAGDAATRRKGWGHELHALRPFRPGDDPRAIHWKRSARNDDLVLVERESERAERLAIVLDNAVADLTDDDPRRGVFERLVSEAATLAVEALERGIEVSLRMREEEVGFGRGARQRHALLEALALVEVRRKLEGDGAGSARLLPDDDRVPHVTLAIDGNEVVDPRAPRAPSAPSSPQAGSAGA